MAKLKTRAWRRLFLDLARTPEGVTDGLSTFNRFVTARAGLATARARLGFCQIYFAAKYGLLYRKKKITRAVYF